jgi:hypothetical protein
MMPFCGPVHDVTEDLGEVDVLAPDDVREFVAAHGGRVFVWVRVPRGLVPTPCMLESSLEPPRKPDLAFRRLRGPGFDIYLEATQRLWPRKLELALHRRRRVEAYWNGMAWIV